ncbi:hypothetical protein F5X96DRAFT_558894 [Biscogniauxia mediterranea]|nr:hypothetical protein F5X96DRAFT_558894 [Biscogniauxia mediterranea]
MSFFEGSSVEAPVPEGLSVAEAEKFKNTCDSVGEGFPDIAGLGVMVSFAGQAFLSLAITTYVFLLSRTGSLEIEHEKGTELYRRQRKRLKAFSQILMVGNDSQMLLGIAYMITIWTKQDNIGVYHLRLGFDTVSLVGVSSIVAFIWTTFCHKKLGQPPHRLSLRYIAAYIYAIFFFALTIVLITHLLKWNETSLEPGFCYETRGTSDAGTEAPDTEIFYVAVTGISLQGFMVAALFGGQKLRRPLVISAILQFILHAYMMVTVREANQPLLEGTEREDDWDFGQTTALALFGLSLLEVGKRAWRYWQWSQESDNRIIEEGRQVKFAGYEQSVYSV